MKEFDHINKVSYNKSIVDLEENKSREAVKVHFFIIAKKYNLWDKELKFN